MVSVTDGGSLRHFVGKRMGYRTTRADKEFSHVGECEGVLPEGIPSFPGPMVMLKGKPGLLRLDHCEVVVEAAEVLGI